MIACGVPIWALEVRGQAKRTMLTLSRKISVRRLLQRIGPGLITGISDDDPSAIGTYVMAGASLGYVALWTALFIFPMMIVVQYLCAKIGLMTNRGIARIFKD